MKVIYSINDCMITFSEEAKSYMSENAHKYGLVFEPSDGVNVISKMRFIKDGVEVVLARHHPIWYDTVCALGYESVRGLYSHFEFMDVKGSYIILIGSSGYETVLTKSDINKCFFSKYKSEYDVDEYFSKILS